MTGLEMSLGLGTAVATVVGTYVGLKIAPLEKEGLALEKAVDDLKREANNATDKLETRLQAIEKTYIDRAELNRVVEMLGQRLDRNTERIEAVVVALGQKVDHLAERVVKAEGT